MGRERELSGRSYGEGDLPHMLRWTSQKLARHGRPTISDEQAEVLREHLGQHLYPPLGKLRPRERKALSSIRRTLGSLPPACASPPRPLQASVPPLEK